MTLLAGEVERCGFCFAPWVDVGLVGEKQLDDALVTVDCSFVKRCQQCLRFPLFHITTSSQELAAHWDGALICCIKQRHLSFQHRISEKAAWPKRGIGSPAIMIMMITMMAEKWNQVDPLEAASNSDIALGRISRLKKEDNSRVQNKRHVGDDDDDLKRCLRCLMLMMMLSIGVVVAREWYRMMRGIEDFAVERKLGAFKHIFVSFCSGNSVCVVR